MPTMYEVRVAGAVPEADLRDMGGVTIASAQLNTVICAVPDQAALYGLLDRLRALGLVVTEVRLMPEWTMKQDDRDADLDTGADDDPAD